METHRALAEKFMYRGVWDENFLPDSLLALVRFVYSEEEAAAVLTLGVTPLPAAIIARRLHRPLSEVSPLLRRLADRCCIARIRVKGVSLYGFLPMAPGVFEAQMSRGEDTPYTRRFAELFEQFYEEFFNWLKPRVERKDLRFGRIIPIEQSIAATPGLGVLALPTDRYSEAVDRNRSFCLMHACSCRHERELIGKGCGRPKDVCSAMGALADFAVDNGLGRRVSRQEFLEAKQRAAAAGLVNLADNLRDPMQMCSCCGCCCGALRILTQFNIPSIIAQSHFVAEIEAKKCRGCRSCERICPMQAIRVKRKKAVLDPARCIGCGLCVLQCDKNRAIHLREREAYLPPAETLGDYALSRFLEVKGLNSALAQSLSLGVGRLIARVSPVHLTGPKYRSRH